MKPKYFQIYELLPQGFYERHCSLTSEEQLFLMFDSRILESADNLRERYGPMVCNDYRWGGDNHLRGWRPTECLIGAELSQHKYGRALDLVPTCESVDKIRQDIIDDKHGYDFRFITAVEMEVSSWLHIDCRNWNKLRNGVLEIKYQWKK